MLFKLPFLSVDSSTSDRGAGAQGCERQQRDDSAHPAAELEVQILAQSEQELKHTFTAQHLAREIACIVRDDLLTKECEVWLTRDVNTT